MIVTVVVVVSVDGDGDGDVAVGGSPAKLGEHRDDAFEKFAAALLGLSVDALSTDNASSIPRRRPGRSVQGTRWHTGRRRAFES